MWEKIGNVDCLYMFVDPNKDKQSTQCQILLSLFNYTETTFGTILLEGGNESDKKVVEGWKRG